MPQNVGSKEDLISKNVPSRHQRDTWALGLRRHVMWRDSVGVGFQCQS